METSGDANSFRKLQQHELDGAAFYEAVAGFTRNEKECEVLRMIAKEEYGHAAIFGKHSGCELKPNRFRVGFRAFAARLFGYTFVLKMLERGEDADINLYRSQIDLIPELRQIVAEEEVHEQQLIGFLDEERLHYVGDIVLGMNDALVELTGSLAGYTLAMQDTHLIAMAGLITGISATLSMASSGYLSSRESGERDAAKSAVYTGFAYLFTVALLVTPFLVFPRESYLWALGVMLFTVLLIIAGFNFYISVAKERPFAQGFLTMGAISIGVAGISFVVGIIVKNVLGIDL